MLMAKGEIMFTLQGNNYTASNHFRVAFSFGDGLLFSGTIKSNDGEYIQGQVYHVDIEFFTIEDEAFELIRSNLKNEFDTAMCAGSRILGIAKLTDFVYEGRPVLISA